MEWDGTERNGTIQQKKEQERKELSEGPSSRME